MNALLLFEVFMQINSRRTITERDRTPLALSTLIYNFADDDTPIKYPLAIGLVDRRLKQQNVKFIFNEKYSFFYFLPT